MLERSKQFERVRSPWMQAWKLTLFTVLLLGPSRGSATIIENQPSECYTLYSNTPSPFNRVFKLKFTPSVTDSLGTGWTQSDIVTFARFVHDTQNGNPVGTFDRVWNYYCLGDQASSSDSVSFYLPSPPRWYSDIQVWLYNPDDFDCPGDPDGPCTPGYVECDCWGGYAQETNHFVLPISCLGARKSPQSIGGAIFAHELQHLADKINKPGLNEWSHQFSEFLSTGAERLIGATWDDPDLYGANPGEYDHSLLGYNANNLRCDGEELYCKYDLYRLFNAYLYEHFRGPVDSLDAVYQMVRYTENGKHVQSLRALGAALMTPALSGRIPGADAAQKVGNVYQRFAMARYANDTTYAGGIYGFGDVSIRNFRAFEWVKALLPASRTSETRILTAVRA